MLIMLFLCWQGETFHQVKITTPVKFQKEDNPKTFITGIRQLESNGEHLFILRDDGPSVLEIKPDGAFVRNIGRSGNGPGEMGMYGLISMAVSGSAVWIFRNDMKALNYFEKGVFVTGFKPEGYQLAPYLLPGYGFAFDENHILLQAHPRNKHLAQVYDYGGDVKAQVGDILPVDREFLRTNPALNNTSWVKDGDSWWCLFLFRPILREFDSQFKLKRELTIHGPEIEEKEEIFFNNEPAKNWKYPKWHFSDFKIFKNSIYLLCEGVLYQVDKKSGSLKSRIVFLTNEAMFAQTNKRMATFHYLAFTDDGNIYLANTILPFDQDGVWTTRLPFDALKE